MALVLTCHPAAPCGYIRAVSVRVGWVSEGVLAFHYRVEGNLDELQVPAQRPATRADGLWKHTCFEAFVKGGDTRAYLELNFSPSSEWAILRFDDYRRGGKPREPEHPPKIVSERQGDDLLELDVTVHLDGLLTGEPRLDRLTEDPRPDHLRLGLAAVLEDRGGHLSYWALAHPTERPDFHHAESFTLSLARPGVPA